MNPLSYPEVYAKVDALKKGDRIKVVWRMEGEDEWEEWIGTVECPSDPSATNFKRQAGVRYDHQTGKKPKAISLPQDGTHQTKVCQYRNIKLLVELTPHSPEEPEDREAAVEVIQPVVSGVPSTQAPAAPVVIAASPHAPVAATRPSDAPQPKEKDARQKAPDTDEENSTSEDDEEDAAQPLRYSNPHYGLDPAKWGHILHGETEVRMLTQWYETRFHQHSRHVAETEVIEVLIRALEGQMRVAAAADKITKSVDWVDSIKRLIGKLLWYEEKAKGMSFRALNELNAQLEAAHDPQWVRKAKSDTARAVKLLDTQRGNYQGKAQGNKWGKKGGGNKPDPKKGSN